LNQNKNFESVTIRF